MKKSTLYFLSILCFSLAGCSNGEEQATNDSSAPKTAEKQAASNKATADINAAKLYGIYCTGCHGNDGQAGINGAKNLALSQLSPSGITEIITQGSENKKMMAYGNLLKKEEIKALSEYVLDLRQSK